MRSCRSATPAVLFAVLAALAALAGCSTPDDDPGVAAPSDPVVSSTTGSSVPVAPATSSPPRATCAFPSLSVPITERYPGATLDHVACGDRQAVLTIIGGEGIDGQGVGFLVSDGTAWTLVATAGSADDPAQVRPGEIRDDLFEQWQQLSKRLPTAARPVPDPNATVTTQSTTTIVPRPGCPVDNPNCSGE